MSNRPASEVLAECVRESGLLPSRVAEELGCSHAALSAILSGKRPGYRMRCAIRRWTRGRIDLPDWDTDEERARIERVVPCASIRRRRGRPAASTEGGR